MSFLLFVLSSFDSAPFPGIPNYEQQAEALDDGDEYVVGIGRSASPYIGNGEDAYNDIDPAIHSVHQYAGKDDHCNRNLHHDRAAQHQLRDRGAGAG